ncbi:MAG TPA: gliding motility lipoprotein GldD, partial [Flavobacteriaceae bacterium]|nr:gliding motility lipoprotein GldD [Flavobacteriaceae bacterium]
MFNYKLTIVLFVLFTVVFTSCKDEAYPKPKAYLKLEYPKAQYNLIKSNCNFEFEKSELATIKYKNNCWMELNYQDLKAKIYITYRPVNNNIEEVLKEVEKLTFEHTIKADAINSQS